MYKRYITRLTMPIEKMRLQIALIRLLPLPIMENVLN